MLHSKNRKPRLLLAILALSLLSIPSGGLISSDTGSSGKTDPLPVVQPDATRGSNCSLSFVVPEGTALQKLEAPACEAAPAAGFLPDLMAKPHRRGFCRCSCGAPCQTSADCGGSSCDPFITCC
jgi:hypothetical protein